PNTALQPDCNSPALSLLCKESGFGSESDNASLSSPASGPDSVRKPQGASVVPRSKIWTSRSVAVTAPRDLGGNQKPLQRAISLDCVWNRDYRNFDQPFDSDPESQPSDTDVIGSEHYYTALERTPISREQDAISVGRSTHERSRTFDWVPGESFHSVTTGSLTNHLSAPRYHISDINCRDTSFVDR
ncbi:hypothetical protein FBUS_08110, partial [Fasciolopsis buskii]